MFKLFRLFSIAFMTMTACTTSIRQEQTMYTLKIDLQDGFKNDSIVIELNGQEIYKKENVSTQLLLGYADTFSKKFPEGEVEAEIRLPLVDLEKTISLNIDHDTYLGISVIAGDIEYIVSDEPFYYQ